MKYKKVPADPNHPIFKGVYATFGGPRPQAGVKKETPEDRPQAEPRADLPPERKVEDGDSYSI